MNAKQKPHNPWTKNTQHQAKKNTNQSKNSAVFSTEAKFKEAHQRLQNAVKKHIKDYESSSDEEDLQSTDVIEAILKNYTQTGGSNEQLGRTQKFLEDSFLSGAATCLICISRIKRNEQIWSCAHCYGSFHLLCIQRWSKDTIVQQKQAIDEQVPLFKSKTLFWCCPKCRFEYNPDKVPNKYLCFCGKTENPKFEPYLVPHSCGDICRKDLQPVCGHKCLLLCHPGPCPPCPVTVSVSCHCGGQEPQTKRCSSKLWSCGSRCGKSLKCGKHTCSAPCHPDECGDCMKKSIQKCVCGSQQKLRDCSEPTWQCDKVCNKPLDCGNHKCDLVCHSGVCDVCLLSKLRTCPCGKNKYQLPCTEETPTCFDTCDKLLECGLHRCNQKCHRGKCETCLEIVVKMCRCGAHSKEIQCSRPYFCETKCKRMKDCNRHPCNRKCCDENCPPCEKPCDRTLNCGNHKCPSVCHRGRCYPCQQTDVVSCRCGATKISVPCGTKHKTKPPKCARLCANPPDCHHPAREQHKCHFGDCPPCRQVCDKKRTACDHPCVVPCHSSVLVKIESQKATMPWEQGRERVEKRELPCPECVVPVPVTCLGEHETADWPCHLARPSSCGRRCGRLLDCENHSCSLECHVVEGSVDKIKAGTNCERCENPCAKTRPEGCPHACPRPCHPGGCPPCKQMLRLRCHCGLTQPYAACGDWLDEGKRDELRSCGNQCPKNFPCGHRCKSNCHPGECPNRENCKKKVKVTCRCKRLKKEFSCETVRANKAVVECDEVCRKLEEERRKAKEELDEKRRLEEEEKNKKELEKYQKMFEGKKKNRERRIYEEEAEISFVKKYWFVLLTTFMVILSVAIYFALN